MDKKVEYFIRDEYKVLKVLIESETIIMGQKVAPLSQDNIAKLTKFSKAKVNAIVNQLIKDKYITTMASAKYQISKEARNVYLFLEAKSK